MWGGSFGQVVACHGSRPWVMAIMIGPSYSKRTDFIDMIAIRVSAFNFVFRPFWFGNLEDGTTKCALMSDGLRFDWAGVFRGIARNLGPTDTICVTLVFLEATRLEC